MNNRKFIKPLLRGYFHEWMFFISVGACIPLIANSTNSVELAATIVYSLGVCMMFGFSALYHRVDWRARVLIIMRKLDHSAIFIMIAGSFTPICLLVLPGDTGIQLLFIIWVIAGIGILQTILFTQTPRLIRASIYLVAGYMAVPYLSVMFSSDEHDQLYFNCCWRNYLYLRSHWIWF